MTQVLRKKSFDRLLPAAFGLVTIALIAFCLSRNQHFFHDDAYITLRYAKHVAAGDGAVWNLHASPVEGFSSPLHMLLLSACLRLGLAAEFSARLIGITAHILLTFLVWRRVRADAGDSAAWLAVLFVGASFPLLVWDLGGLETPLFALLIFAAIDAAIDYFRNARAAALCSAGFLFGIAYATRPDAVVFLSTTLGLALVRDGLPTRRSIRNVAMAGGAVAVVALPLTAWRLLSFGTLFANTYYAKVQNVPLHARLWLGVKYVFGVVSLPPFMFAFLPPLWIGTSSHRLADKAQPMLCLNIVVYLLSVTVAGGDHMLAARFLVPVIPLGAVVMATMLSRAGLVRRYALPLVACCSAQALIPYLNPHSLDPAALVGTIVGQYIARAWPDGSLIALNTAGSVPYIADNKRYIDMLGLNDVTIAHRKISAGDIEWGREPLIGHLKGDGNYVLSRAPDFIIAGPAEGTLLVPGVVAKFLGDRELNSSQAFRIFWRPCQVRLTVPANLAPQVLETTGLHDFLFTFYAKRGVHVQGCDGN